MTVQETIKRRLTRAHKRLDQWIGYSNTCSAEGPSLNCSLDGGYSVLVSFRDLAYLVRKADEYASSKDFKDTDLKNWRDLK